MDALLHCEGAARKTSLPPIKGALHPQPAPVEDVGIDHRRADVGVAEELLDRADVVPAFEQVCGERVPERILTLPMNRLLRSFITVTIPSTANT